MAEGDGKCYQSFKRYLMEGKFDLTGDTINCILVTGYTLDEDGHSAYANVSASELTDTSYSAQALTGLSVSSSGTGTGTAVMGKWDAADVTFSSLTTGSEPNYAILYDDTVTSPADALVGAWELTTNTNGGNYSGIAACSPCW